MNELTKSLELTQDQLEGKINNIKQILNIWKQALKESKMIFWLQMTYPQN